MPWAVFQDATHEYIREANAVLFVHSLDSPVESASFRNFVNNVVPEHTRETLFLLLTKSGKNSSDDIYMKVKEARRLYTTEIDHDRILHVDSLLKIVSDEVEEFDSAAALKEHYRQQAQDCKAEKRRDEASTFEAKRRLLNNVLDDVRDDSDRETVQSELRKLSNFDELECLIDNFSSQAPWIQLKDLLSSVKTGYDNQTAHYGQNLAAWEKKKKSPQTFEKDINDYRSRLDEYQFLMNEFGEKASKNYSGTSASFLQKLKEIRAEHISRIDTATSLDSAKRELENSSNSIRSLGDDVAAEIRTRFKEESERLGGEFKAKYSISMPTIDIAAIDIKARDEAYERYDVPRSPRGAWEWTLKIASFGLKKFAEEKSKLSNNKYLSNFKSDALKELEKISSAFYHLVSDLVGNYQKSFRSILKTLIESRKKGLEVVEKRKATNEELLADIAAAKRKKKAIAAEVIGIDDMLGDIQ